MIEITKSKKKCNCNCNCNCCNDNISHSESEYSNWTKERKDELLKEIKDSVGDMSEYKAECIVDSISSHYKYQEWEKLKDEENLDMKAYNLILDCMTKNHSSDIKTTEKYMNDISKDNPKKKDTPLSTKILYGFLIVLSAFVIFLSLYGVNYYFTIFF